MMTLEDVEAAGGYSVILADPPWQYNDRKPRGGAEHHYLTTSTDTLRELPVARLAASDCALFLWATYPMIREAFAVIAAWGFDYKTLAFQWVKLNKKAPSDFVGLGHWTRGNTEPCLLATRGKPQRADAGVRQVLLDTPEELVVAPVGHHSAKPAEVRSRIERLMGDVPRLEMFARERAPGWDCHGNEVVSDVVLR